MEVRKQKHNQSLINDKELQMSLLDRNKLKQEEDNRKLEQYKENLRINKD